MNRLREQSYLSTTAAWTLAAAYAKAGQPEAAKKIISNLTTQIEAYRELGYCYGSNLRDKALILETLALLNEKVKGFEVLKDISKYMGDYGYWMSTQETAFCLKAISSYAGLDKQGELKFSFVLNGKSVHASSELPVEQIQKPITGLNKESIKIESESKGSLFARVIMQGTPAQGDEEETQNNLNLSTGALAGLLAPSPGRKPE